VNAIRTLWRSGLRRGLKQAGRRLGGGGEGQSGFTLVELLVTVLVSGIMSAAILGLFLGMLRVFASEGSRMLSQDGARLATQEMARYIRGASSSVSNTTSNSDAVAVAQPQELVFFTDVNGDGNTEKLRFYMSGTTLYMQRSTPNMADRTYPAYSFTSALCVGVRNGTSPIFTYYYYRDGVASGTPTTLPGLYVATLGSTPTAAQLRLIVGVGINLNVNEQPALAPSGALLSTVIQIRQRSNGGI
jgi:prepilin-type N-terminal cleavage/methylation domain-containing protein